MLDHLLSVLTTPWALAGSVLVLLICYAWTKTRLKHEGSNIPPFPAPAKPFLGHTLLMKGDFLENMAWMRKKAGDIFSLNLFGQHVIVVSGYENIRNVLVKNSDKTLNRPVDMSSQVLGEENHGLLSSRGANWKEQRAATNSILREFGMGKTLLAEKVASEVHTYIAKLVLLEGKAVDLPSILTPTISNVVCDITFGEKFDFDDPYFKRMMENLHVFLCKSPPVWAFNLSSVIRMLPGDLFGMKEWIARTVDLNENFCKFQINKIKQQFSEEDEPMNFIAGYLREIRKREKGEKVTYLDEPNLVSIIKSLLVGGTDTTSMTITWCVLYCLHNPEVQDKVFEEIKTHVGTARVPAMSDMPKLPYLNAVIRETQRLGSLAPATARVVSDSFELQGYLIPKDSQLMLNYDSAHQDENAWGESPDKFNPERFIGADGNVLKPNEFIPFGVGPHACVAEAFGRMELQLFLSAMFQKLRFEPEDPAAELPSLEGVMVITRRPKPYNVRFRERNV